MTDPTEPIPGIRIGHWTSGRRPTGVTVVLAPAGAVAGVDVRGAAPGTRETDLLNPVNTVPVVHAVVLAGGSAFGLAAATGVMQWLEEHGFGLPVGPVRVPIVPAAVLFDLSVGDPTIRPDHEAGYQACVAAQVHGALSWGSVGAGAGATVGKLFGPGRAMRGGIGQATTRANGVTVTALVACNAVGDVMDPDTGRILAGARVDPGGLELLGTWAALLRGQPPESALADPARGAMPPAGSATTIGVVITDAALTKPQAARLATLSHDGLARTVRPAHTHLDGDTMFALATGRSGVAMDLAVLGAMTVETTARAVAAGIRAASGLRIGADWIPAWVDR